MTFPRTCERRLGVRRAQGRRRPGRCRCRRGGDGSRIGNWLAQQRNDDRIERVDVKGAGLGVDQLARAIDDVVGRDRVHVVIRPAHPMDEGDGQRVGQRPQLVLRNRVLRGDGQHLKAVFAVGPVRGLKRRQLLAARGAPGGPEVEDHHVALEIGQLHRATVKGGDRGVGCAADHLRFRGGGRRRERHRGNGRPLQEPHRRPRRLIDAH